MSATLDASGIAQLALRLGLASAETVSDCLDELGDKTAPATDMVRLMERKRHLTPWQGNKLLKGELDGYFLGGYRLLYKIASGSFGRVYRGDEPRSGQVVAVKVLRNKWTMDKQKVDLFLREGKLGLSIRHPNIVSVLAVNQDAKTGQYFIVMEFVEGGNLRDLLQARKKLGADESLRILEECAQGLAYSHARGLTHRDIKPTNILIGVATGQAKLVDYGLAEITENAPMQLKRQEKDKDEDVAVDRTVDYAGLEKATNQKAGDVRSDIYFLGCVLYECLTGHTLMPVTKDRQTRMQARRYQDVEETLAKNGPTLGVPPPVMRLLARMVAFEPTERFQTPTQLAEAIQACRADLAGVKHSKAPTGPKTLFVVEQNQKLQDAFRDKFKAQGFRVLLTIDPNQAVKRYQQQAYHAVIIDARTVGHEGVTAFNDVLRAADHAGMDVAAVLILSEEQENWKAEARDHAHGAVLSDPGVTMKQLFRTLNELVPDDEQSEEE